MARNPSIRRKIFHKKYLERKRHLQALEQLAMLCLLGAEDDDDEDSAMVIAAMALDEAAKLKEEMRSKNFGPRGSYNREQSDEFFRRLLDRFSDRCFQSWIRMGRKSFWELHDLISDHEVFKSKGKKPQRPVKYQLATFLCRVGAETSVKIASVMSIAEGSVYLSCKRVCRAIRHMRTTT
ncbi:hypothetical protein DFP72DRAFT_1078899 [Ephemerocybe angulata]|uniref:Uncharacterized protein n=1 Tax=Ephemerocybe angulata TaxID=980116 RepID=A0A8H6HDL1_9AGAR|nr:hypothetical protein DFP72DRAFT_1078899 [Tulosesus angulatus]